MVRSLLIILTLFGFGGFAQDQLVNTFSSWHEIYGGTEDSGISRTESYIFVAKKNITLKGIYFDDKEITLKANDTIQISISSHRPYGKQENIEKRSEKPDQPKIKDRFKFLKKNNCYYGFPQYPYEWPKSIEYVYKKKSYTATAKKEFDKGGTDAAP